MRIPLTRVYRAFPELDRFSDDQCSRFVRAACKRGWRRHVHRALLVILTPISVLCTLLVLGMALEALADALGRSFEYSTTYDVLLFSVLAAGFLPVFGAMLIRDRLLLRRIRSVLRARCTCPACRYSLLGIVVAENNVVTCPECGIEVEADPSLNELTTDDQGRARFTPTESVKTRRFWTQRRLRLLKRVALALAALLFIVLPLGWGGYEVFLHRQAAAARAERPGVQGILEFVEAHQPPGTLPTDANAWDAFDEAHYLRSQIDAEIISQLKFQNAGGPDVYPAFWLIYDEGDLDASPDMLAYDMLCKALAEESLLAYQEQGLYDAIDAITPHRRAVRGISGPSSQPLLFSLLPSLSEARVLARLNAARMHIAHQQNDLDGFISAFESILALARICRSQPTPVQSHAAAGMENLAYIRLRDYLAQHPSPEWLDAIDAAIKRQSESPPRDYPFRGRALMTIDAIAWTFSEPTRARFGRFSQGLGTFSGSFGLSLSTEGRLATYATNRAACDEFFEQVAQAALLEPYKRGPLPIADGNLLLTDLLYPEVRYSLQTLDTLEAHRRATTTMLALERYYLAKTTYPDTLAALVPEYLPTLPLDPWTGNPLVYRPLDAQHQTSYRLYSVGPDATDDGGDGGTSRNGGRDIVFSRRSE